MAGAVRALSRTTASPILTRGAFGILDGVTHFFRDLFPLIAGLTAYVAVRVVLGHVLAGHPRPVGIGHAGDRIFVDLSAGRIRDRRTRLVGFDMASAR
jgi:hypothetical protein